MSTDPRADAERLQQAARREWFEERCGREPWFTAWQYVYNDERMGWLSCYLVPAADTDAQLKSPDYGRIPRRFHPGFDGFEEETQYARYGNTDGYEPLIHHRSWDGLHRDEIEVAEEYRLFHNLFLANDGNLARVSEGGDSDETIVRKGYPPRSTCRGRPLLLTFSDFQLGLACGSSAEVAPSQVKAWPRCQETHYAPERCDAR